MEPGPDQQVLKKLDRRDAVRRVKSALGQKRISRYVRLRQNSGLSITVDLRKNRGSCLYVRGKPTRSMPGNFSAACAPQKPVSMIQDDLVRTAEVPHSPFATCLDFRPTDRMRQATRIEDCRERASRPHKRVKPKIVVVSSYVGQITSWRGGSNDRHHPTD